jgi:hypothetical protein
VILNGPLLQGRTSPIAARRSRPSQAYLNSDRSLVGPFCVVMPLMSWPNSCHLIYAICEQPCRTILIYLRGLYCPATEVSRRTGRGDQLSDFKVSSTSSRGWVGIGCFLPLHMLIIFPFYVRIGSDHHVHYWDLLSHYQRPGDPANRRGSLLLFYICCK